MYIYIYIYTHHILMHMYVYIYIYIYTLPRPDGLAPASPGSRGDSPGSHRAAAPRRPIIINSY